MAATFNGNPRAANISCYSPTNVSEETFYEELSSLVRSIPKHNLLVIGGDMNAQIGKNRNSKYSLHNASNRNGQHLTDFMIENRLTCNTNYQKREGKSWTYTYANNSKAQIDYVFINKKWKNCAMNYEEYSSFDGVSSDHRIVTAKLQLSLRKNATRTATTKHDWALLKNRDIRDKYVLELRNGLETLQEKTEKGTPYDETEYMCYNQTGDISKLDGASLKLVDKFTHLGSNVSSTGKDIDTRLTKAYIQQLCEDTGCNPEDLPEAMNDREKWQERIRDIRASGTTWWWWYIYIYIYIYGEGKIRQDVKFFLLTYI